MDEDEILSNMTPLELLKYASQLLAEGYRNNITIEIFVDKKLKRSKLSVKEHNL